MHHPANKTGNFLSVVPTTLCTALCLLVVPKWTRTRTSGVILCSLGQEGHTVAVLKDHWRPLMEKAWLECGVMTPLSHQSLFLCFFYTSWCVPPLPLSENKPPLTIWYSERVKACHEDEKTEGLLGKESVGRWWRFGVSFTPVVLPSG